MQDFNLIISTGRTFEPQAEVEMWFNLLALGEDYPVFFQTGNPGLFLGNTKADPRALIHHLNEIISNRDPQYIQFIHKIYPIDKVVPTEIDRIRETTLDLIKNSPLCQDPASKYRISIRKRQSPLKTEEIIPALADVIAFSVSLKEYDWIVQIEIIGESTGIAIISDRDIFQPISTKP